jgi:hypothetical protein
MSTSEVLLAAPPAREEIRRRVLAAIRELHGAAGGLTRVHRTHPSLYAQARRAFGSWRAAVALAGLDYGRERDRSLRDGLSMRDERRALAPALAHFLLDHPSADDARLERERPALAAQVRRCWGDFEAARAWAARRARK